MTKGAEQNIFQGQHKAGQQAHEKAFNTINFKTIANQNYNEISSHTVRMFINKKTINVLERCGEKETFVHCEWGWILVQPTWRFYKKLKIQPLYDSAIPLLGIYLMKTRTPVQEGICIPIFAIALVAKTKMEAT